MIVAAPGPNAVLMRSASSFKPASPSQRRLGFASARFTFLAGLAAGLAGAAAAGEAPEPSPGAGAYRFVLSACSVAVHEINSV